jgi:putative transposase
MEHEAGAGRRKAPMQRAHKIRLNPTPQQTEYLRKACGTARFAFNWGLAEWQKEYAAGGKPSAYILKKQFNTIKREQFPWVLDVSKCAVDTGFRNLDAAFKRFFRRCKNGDTKKGYPKFKSKKRSKLSFSMDGTRVRVDGHWLKLERLDKPINMAEVLRFDGEIKSVTISEHGGHWYTAINGEVEPPKHKHPQGSVGIDVGVKTLAVLSDGMRYENQVLLRSKLRKLKRLNRELSRRQKGSGRWNHTRKKLARFHRRIADKRLDYLHNMTTRIARTYRIIGVEDLNVAGMLRNRRLALSIADAGFGEIQRQLRYKSEWYGGILVEVDRFFPSSRLCPMCGAIKSDLTLRDRTFVCECGYVADRDVNGAQNIEREALRLMSRGRSGFTDSLNGREQNVRPFGAVLDEASKLAEERQPSRPAVV